MKRLILLAASVFAFTILNAQWVDDAMNNTFIANCDDGAGEVRVAASPDGGTFVQWTSMSSNGWSPKLQYLNHDGVPQWGHDGIAITTDNLATWSPGYALAALSDGSVVSMFRSADARHWVVKINPDGSTPWGTDGIPLFDGLGGGRSELLAGDDGGFWALGTDMDVSYLCYVNADGTFQPTATISDPSKKCSNGVLIPADNGVFVVYSKHTIQNYTNYNKGIYLAGYNKNGEQIVPETLLLYPVTVGATYIHYAIPDGIGGGYVYQWHKASGNVHRIYITHFNANGEPTIMDSSGEVVQEFTSNHHSTSAYTTIDPLTHDLIIAYRITDVETQTQDQVLVNRITSEGEKPWNYRLTVTENVGDYSDIMVDAFEYGNGFSVIYTDGSNAINAVGYDMDGNFLWNTTMSTTGYAKSVSANSTGFHFGQNITAWVNASNGGVYGQNIGQDGNMGEITPPAPPFTCYPPSNFQGEYYYNEETMEFGAMLSWSAPQVLPLHYNLYFTDPSGCETILEIAPTETAYLNLITCTGAVSYRLTAVYEDCESDFALTPTGEDFLLLEVTSLPETVDDDIVTITKVYTITGQLIHNTNLDELSPGVYIIQGLTSGGRLLTRKIVTDNQ